MPWKGVTVSEERQRFLGDYRLKSYSIAELAELPVPWHAARAGWPTRPGIEPGKPQQRSAATAYRPRVVD
jgi:hypothetical protein